MVLHKGDLQHTRKTPYTTATSKRSANQTERLSEDDLIRIQRALSNPEQTPTPQTVLVLQRTVGNRIVQLLLDSAPSIAGRHGNMFSILQQGIGLPIANRSPTAEPVLSLSRDSNRSGQSDLNPAVTHAPQPQNLLIQRYSDGEIEQGDALIDNIGKALANFAKLKNPYTPFGYSKPYVGGDGKPRYDLGIGKAYPYEVLRYAAGQWNGGDNPHYYLPVKGGRKYKVIRVGNRKQVIKTYYANFITEVDFTCKDFYNKLTNEIEETTTTWRFNFHVPLKEKEPPGNRDNQGNLR